MSVHHKGHSSGPGDPWLLAALWALAIGALAGAARLLLWYWPGRVFDGVTSHIWTALAWDLDHGELYRLPLGPRGYGGTRYMPLLFSAHALLLRAGVDPIHAGVALMQVSVIAAGAALYFALRSSCVSARVAAPLAMAVFGTVIYQQYCTDLDPDYLAAGLAISGVALALRRQHGDAVPWQIAAAAAVALAALAKVTALAYVLPIGWWLITSRNVRAAAWFVFGATALFVAAAGLVQVVSHGAFLESFRATVGGGMGLSDVGWAMPKFGREIAIDPLVGVPYVVACGCAIASARRGHTSLAHQYLAAASVVTLVIFASPGTVGNHLVDLHLASLLVIGIAIADGQLSARPTTAVFASLATLLAAISIPIAGVPSVIATLRAQAPPSRAAVREIHEEFLPPGTRYLSMDPIIAVLNGERPVVLDAFNLNRFVRDGTPAGRDVELRLRRHEFAFVILREDRGSAQDRNDLERFVYSNYDVRAVRPPFVIFAPRADRP
jgi:hypothetical protein